jgi:UDP-N-acetylmuramate dehydrogenase
MQVQQNVSLKQYNTFGIDARAAYFASFTSAAELQELLSFSRLSAKKNHLILGGGSNILFTNHFDGLVLKNEIKGIELVKEDDEFVYLRAGAGENWHQFVMYCVSRNWGGVENLSLIPGNVGASPMQNIGAYGAEIKDTVEEVNSFHINDGSLVAFTNKGCEFGYRESVFKRKYKNQFVILTVTFKLRKHPVLNTSYGAINQELEQMGDEAITVKKISQAVINIRSSKLPDPKEIGNAGSFFKNPGISKDQYQALQVKHPGIIGYANPDGTVKIAAGWLIEQCGWKGYRKGDAGCHAKQALVLVNYGKATGSEILALSKQIKQSVFEKFAVQLETEVNIVV